MEKILIDPTQIYVFPEFLLEDKSLQTNIDRADNFLSKTFNLKTNIVNVFEQTELSNIPNANMDFDFQAFIFRNKESTFVTSTQDIEIDVGHMIFCAGRVLDYTIKSDEDFIIINFNNTQEY